MSEFTSGFWSVYILVITVASIAGCGIFLWKLTTKRLPAGQKVGVMGHVWDENLEEYNNPLPRWWLWLFYITLVFGAVYLILYPGLGSFPGLLKWTSHGQYEREQALAKQRYEPIYAKYAAMSIPQLAADPQAREIGQRLFLNYCAQCHASDGRGGKGFPNLTDNDWLYGGDPETITASITNGRSGMMPPWASVLGEEGVKDVANYVLQMSGKTYDSLRATHGKELFQQNCIACHGPEGKGNPAVGAPNLTDDISLYGGGQMSLIETISKGRNGVMPAWGGFLGPEKVHLLAAYVYGFSHPDGK
ncbi:MAG TPA: cytochrome-c oxidase, cbb3-type subunit III [Burkholderiales bacterium]|nr:cytochrome-c oxidase, cbb3-type subunit III [Burkholderiales bacterium]